MKFLGIILLSTCIWSSSISYGKPITVEIPDNLFPPETTFSGNFDGSINIENPKLFYSNNYYPVSGDFNDLYEYKTTSWYGLCAVLGKKYVDFESTTIAETTKILFLRMDGTLRKSENCQWGANFGCHIIARVTCK